MLKRRQTLQRNVDSGRVGVRWEHLGCEFRKFIRSGASDAIEEFGFKKEEEAILIIQ
jgi:hypothetical protein